MTRWLVVVSLVACSSPQTEWSARWAERIDDDQIVVVWRQGCDDASRDQGRAESVRLADGSSVEGTGGQGAIHVLAKTPGVLWYTANGTYAVELPEMVRHRVESSLAAHPQLGPSLQAGPRVRGVSGDLLVVAGTDTHLYVVSADGSTLRAEEHPIAEIPDLRTDLVPDLRRPSASDAKRDRVFYVAEAGRPVSAGAERWLIVSSKAGGDGHDDRQNLHAVGPEGVAWSRAVADLAGGPAGADTRLLWASDDDGLHVLVTARTECRFTNALVRLNPQTGATMSTHVLVPTE